MTNMSTKSEDCLSCRLISGFGIIGVGVYIYYQAKRRKTMESYTMKAISAELYCNYNKSGNLAKHYFVFLKIAQIDGQNTNKGAVTLGLARLLNMQFLKSTKDGR